MKAHLPVFDGDSTSLKNMIKIVDEMPEIVNWHVVFDSTICIASEIEARRLAGRLNTILPDIRYNISEIQPDGKGGRMNLSILDLMNTPAVPERESV